MLLYVGETRISTKTHLWDVNNIGEEGVSTYYYHSDHLGSAQFITDYLGKEYERFEYTPYGELWIERTGAGMDKLPFRFTGKELDEETNLYYYGARYLDPKTSRWLSADPAMGEYIPGAPINDEVRKRNGNLPGMGGIFNTVNLHTYHYAGNNPIKYTDPDGRSPKGWISSWMAEPSSQGGKSISSNAPQRAGGYTSFYENFTSNSIFANIDASLFSFENGNGDRVNLWLWKGDYNLADKASWDRSMSPVMEWHNGGEIATYIQSGIGDWAASTDGVVKSMSYDLYKKGSDSPFLSRKNNGEFWLNGFLPGDRQGPGNITMRGQINFRSEADATAFMNARRQDHAGKGSGDLSFSATQNGPTVNFVYE